MSQKLGQLLNIDDLCRMFDVTEMTIHRWRKRLNLPVVLIPGHKVDAVRYDDLKVRKWAARNGIKIVGI
jgi:hypothetical protein